MIGIAVASLRLLIGSLLRPSSIMSLAQELGGVRSELGVVRSTWLDTRRINDALRNHNVAEIAQFIRSSENFEDFILDSPPVNEEFGRHLFDAIVQGSHIRKVRLDNGSCTIRDLVAWIGSRNTLVNMTSLETVVVVLWTDMSVLDCSALFPLLLTSSSLHSFTIYFHHDDGSSDDVMSALLSYLGTASLSEFEFRPLESSEAAFTALCNGVALSTVRRFTLGENNLHNLDLETAAESLARMIEESSLEEVAIASRVSTWSEIFISALKLTAPVQNMDFAFTHVVDVGHGNRTTHLRIKINRKWKPIIFSANTPSGLWPHILEKSHVFPETSHFPADIVFYVLRQKPDLVPAP